MNVANLTKAGIRAFLLEKGASRALIRDSFQELKTHRKVELTVGDTSYAVFDDKTSYSIVWKPGCVFPD